MNTHITSLNVKGGNFKKVFSELPLIIDKADSDGPPLYLNYLADSYEDITRASLLHELLRNSNIPYELNISFNKSVERTGWMNIS